MMRLATNPWDLTPVKHESKPRYSRRKTKSQLQQKSLDMLISKS
jgi:hypothetical protein